MNPLFLTTTIPYVNAKPHLGFALELVQADCLARFHRKRGATVYLRTGTDENAFKNVEAARRHRVDTGQWVNSLSVHFRLLAENLHIQFDDFIRTTEARHRQAVETILSRLDPGDLERRNYHGYYCVGCEDFWQTQDIVEDCCPEHKTQLTEVEEENVFFRLSRYQEQIDHLISSDTLVIRPLERKNEILAFIRRGLQDISISRCAERSGNWGIPFPGVEGQVVYVWIDALINYLVTTGGAVAWDETTRKIHLLGKNVWKFHAIYWPALLLSCGLPLPSELFIHGFVTIDGRKISKSSGPRIDPIECLEKYGTDAIRFYLLHEIPAFGDGDFSFDRLERTYTHYLVNGLGNLSQRLLKLAELSHLTSLDLTGANLTSQTEKALHHGEFALYLDGLWKEIGDLNLAIEQARPWVEFKQGNAGAVREKCAHWLSRLYQVAVDLEPALPETSVRLVKLLRAERLGPLEKLFSRLG